MYMYLFICMWVFVLVFMYLSKYVCVVCQRMYCNLTGFCCQVRRLRREAEEEQRRRREDALARQRVRLRGLRWSGMV